MYKGVYIKKEYRLRSYLYTGGYNTDRPVRLLFILAAYFDLDIILLDIKTTFLNTYLKKKEQIPI